MDTTTLAVMVANELHDLEYKRNQFNYNKIDRNLRKLRTKLEEAGFVVINPINESYDETRTDCEATIVGDQGKRMRISKVIKPIVYTEENGRRTLVQKGIVTVEAG